ncbi:hypothetical protein [Pseudomonas sp. MWU13-3659]|uniref:hypothetical protein n=1 Tax=Pseudomonas sp. MWU13-3659 TaxID=2986964 RepID=UPI002075991D|nr:hypothetical protein [Pseudomonas sp. MWU13-3659]
MSLEENFKIEKYKYILARKQALNEVTFKIVAVYQALILALFAGQYAVYTSAGKGTLTPALALQSTYVLFALFVMVSVLILALLVGGVFSWMSYRQDESEIELAVTGVPKRPIALADLWRWYETYLVLFVLVFSGGGIWGYMKFILPVFNG